MDQIDLALLTLRFLARVQLLCESMQLFRSAPHLLHDTSCLAARGEVAQVYAVAGVMLCAVAIPNPSC